MNKKSILYSAILSVSCAFAPVVAKAEVLCAKKNGQTFARSECKANEREVQANRGPQGTPGLAAIGQASCSDAMVGLWSSYIVGSAFNDIESCGLYVAPGGKVSGSCYLYLRKENVNIVSGSIKSENLSGLKSCYVTGSFQFNNGVKGTIDATMSPDQNNVVGVQWNSAGGAGAFSATRLVE